MTIVRFKTWYFSLSFIHTPWYIRNKFIGKLNRFQELEKLNTVIASQPVACVWLRMWLNQLVINFNKVKFFLNFRFCKFNRAFVISLDFSLIFNNIPTKLSQTFFLVCITSNQIKPPFSIHSLSLAWLILYNFLSLPKVWNNGQTKHQLSHYRRWFGAPANNWSTLSKWFVFRNMKKS